MDINKNIMEKNLEKNEANYAPLSPISFLIRSANIWPDKIAWVHGNKNNTYKQLLDRCSSIASGLVKTGISKGDTVSAILPNVPAMIECHFAVLMAGAVLNTINTRLDHESIKFILQHGEAKAIFVDPEYLNIVEKALKDFSSNAKPLIINCPDEEFIKSKYKKNEFTLKKLIKKADKNFKVIWPKDEWDACSLNYTSGTTGDPKGVVYHHRGAWLTSISNQMVWEMQKHPKYLWTLPMFHCNGWCFPWTITAMAGTHVCLRKVEAKYIYNAIKKHNISHFCGAPIVLSMLINAKKHEIIKPKNKVKIMTAASAPPPEVLAAIEEIGFEVTHVYGLTEVYGPAVICEWKEEWDKLSRDLKAKKKARQGVRYPALSNISVRKPEDMSKVPSDGKTIGEVMLKGNMVMKGYLKNKKTTQESFSGGWFHTGDLGVMHPDSYIELKDRSKDIIISGGENISSIEVEETLYKNPNILAAAVVSKPDEKWGEVPCAFVELKDGKKTTQTEIINFCKKHLANFKCPKFVVIGLLPKTSTGKIKKFELREKARNI